jgi:hypothetical protein
MNNQLIIGGTIAVILLILVAILILKKKEKYTLNANANNLVQSSGTGTPTPALSYLSTDSNGNISVTNSGQFNNVDIEGNLTLKGYTGKVGDVLVSNGSAPPVWADITPVIGKSNGYQILPGGLIIQWGLQQAGWGSGDPFTFPVAFPNNCLSVTATTYYAGYKPGDVSPSGNNIIMVTNLQPASFSVVSPASQPFYWMAIGN